MHASRRSLLGEEGEGGEEEGSGASTAPAPWNASVLLGDDFRGAVTGYIGDLLDQVTAGDVDLTVNVTDIHLRVEGDCQVLLPAVHMALEDVADYVRSL